MQTRASRKAGIKRLRSQRNTKNRKFARSTPPKSAAGNPEYSVDAKIQYFLKRMVYLQGICEALDDSDLHDGQLLKLSLEDVQEAKQLPALHPSIEIYDAY